MGPDVIWCQDLTDKEMDIFALVEAGTVINFVEVDYSQVRQTLGAVRYEISSTSDR